MIKNKKKGILFWLTGLPGAGKTSIANKIIKSINKSKLSFSLKQGNMIENLFNMIFIYVSFLNS